MAASSQFAERAAGTVTAEAGRVRGASWADRFHLTAIALLALFTPVLQLFRFGGAEANLSVGDAVVALLAPWAVFRFLSRGLRLPIIGLCLGALAVALLSMFVNAEVSLTTKGPLGMLVEFAKVALLWVYFYLAANLMRNRSDLLWMVKVWVAGSALVAIAGIGGSLAYQFAGIETQYADYYRAHGTLRNANFFSLHMGVSFLLGVFYLVVARRGYWWVVPAMALQLGGIVLAASRGGLLAFTLSLGALLVFRGSVALKRVAIGLVILAGLLLAAWPDKNALLRSNPVTERLATTTVDLNDSAAAERRELWRHAWNGFLSSPAIGVGIGNSLTFDRTKTGKQLEAHNSYIGILCETGIAGLVMLLAGFSYFPIRLLLRQGRELPARWITGAWCLAAAFANTALVGVTTNVENFRGLWMLMAIAFGYLALCPPDEPGRKETA